MILTADIWPQDRWPNFTCSETGECAMDRLQLLRYHDGHPLTITSGYSSPAHSSEVSSQWGPTRPQATHAKSRAVDISCAGIDAYEILTEVLVYGDRRKQKGERRFLYIDDLEHGEHTVQQPIFCRYQMISLLRSSWATASTDLSEYSSKRPLIKSDLIENTIEKTTKTGIPNG